eukprot:scaffold686_cov234-Pinguiococcus_pyrenoidosus.AAC.1
MPLLSRRTCGFTWRCGSRIPPRSLRSRALPSAPLRKSAPASRRRFRGHQRRRAHTGALPPSTPYTLPLLGRPSGTPGAPGA